MNTKRHVLDLWKVEITWEASIGNTGDDRQYCKGNIEHVAVDIYL